MKRFARTCCVAVVAASCATTAHAAQNPPKGWGAAMYTVAQQYWGTLPHCDVTISFDVPLEEGVIGQELNCHIDIAHNEILVECQATVHELGHVLGLEHSADEHSIMYPLINRHNVPSLCVGLLDRYRPGQSRIALKRL